MKRQPSEINEELQNLCRKVIFKLTYADIVDIILSFTTRDIDEELMVIREKELFVDS